MLKRICIGFEIDVAHDFDMRIEISLQPWALFGSNERIIDQQVFGAVLGSLSLSASLSWYLALEKLIAFDRSSVMSIKMAWLTVFDPFYFWKIDFSFLLGIWSYHWSKEGPCHHIKLFCSE